MKKKMMALMLALVLTFCLLSGCSSRPEVSTALPEGGDSYLTAAVLYDSRTSDGAWEDVFSHLSQSLLLGLRAVAIDVSVYYRFDEIDVLYPDASVMTGENAEKVRADIVSFAENGGGVFLTNEFYDFFDRDFIGAKDFVKIDGYPQELTYPEVGADMGEIQGVVADFASVYPSYTDFGTLSGCDYGWAVVPAKARALVRSGRNALYTINDYGEGKVLFTNPLLPNVFSINGFSLAKRSDVQQPLANTTASCNQLIENAFASYISKCRYGLSMWRVFGCFGRPSMSWELHYEEITGIENGSALMFADICTGHDQIPSYTLIRNSYWWFLRAESVTYLLNGADAGSPLYSMDYYESAYSSGTHIAAGDEWLSLASIEEGGSYFVDYPEHDYRAYPEALDYDGDGDADIFCGSADGGVYYFEGEGFTDRLHTAAAVAVTDTDGRPINVGGYSAPALCDVDGDGYLDMAVGGSDGRVSLYMGGGTLAFEPAGTLLESGGEKQMLPELADLDGDGLADLVCGTDTGELTVFWGGEAGFSAADSASLSELAQTGGLGSWLAPCVTDLDGDGVMDLAVGTFDGYIARLVTENGESAFEGFMTCTEKNYKGSNNIKFGNWCVPRFFDLDGDGDDDLVCGSLEYGLAYPIDSEYFPLRDKLQAQIDEIQKNGWYISAHFYTNEYASPEREEYELASQKAAMESYGVELGVSGTNQHTWWTSTLSPTQSFESIWNAGLLWDSGFTPSGSRQVPQVAAENVVALPFFLEKNGQRTLLVQNTTTLLYSGEEWTDISAKYGMPICMFYHCDFIYESDDAATANIEAASAFRLKHNYNFVREDQTMKATAAAYNLTLSLHSAGGDGLDLTLTPDFASAEPALFDLAYARSCGVRVSFGEAYDAGKIATDADVWYRDGQDLYLGLGDPVRLWQSDGGMTGTHLERVNVAASVTSDEHGAVVKFLDGGMMQAEVAGTAGTDDAGWSVSTVGGKTTFTKFSPEPDTLHITF